jgi:hypothetical protein
MFKMTWLKLVIAAAVIGLGLGSARIGIAQEEGEGDTRESLSSEFAGGNYPNQCYYSCQGCGGTCGGTRNICCTQ